MTNPSTSTTCAHCGNPLPVVEGRIQQWRVRDQFACNEFCAEGIEERSSERRAA